jgi:HK97 family phage major capsid protein
MTPEQLKKALADKLGEIRAVAKAAEDEKRDFSDAERNQLKALTEEAGKLRKDYDDAAKGKADDDALRKAIDALGGGIDFNPNPQPNITGNPTPGGKGTSVGERFVTAPAFKSWLAQFPGGRIPEGRKGIMSPPIDIGSIKALVTGVSDTSAGALVFPQDLGLQDAGGAFQRPLTIRDIVTVGTTTSDTVEYVRVTGFTNAAAPVPEATISGPIPDPDTANTAGLKPESSLALARISTSVKTIAHWIPATKRALSDAGQIRTLIDNFLRYGLAEELEDQMVNGNGSGENFYGINNISGTQAQAWDTNILTTTRKARTKVRVVGRATPTAYLLNPADWEIIDLLQDNEGRYFYGGPAMMGQPRLWGLPVVESEAVTAGMGYVGDFRTLVLWDREQSSIQVSDSHNDYFVRNLVAILAELRAAFGAFRPSAIVEMDLTA